MSIMVDQDTGWIDKELRAVVWSGGDTFWTAGQYGLAFHTADAGVNWTQAVDTTVDVKTFQEYEFEGLDFVDATFGVFVGWSRTSPGGKALSYKSGNWSDISPADPEIKRINDVKILGDVAYAVAEKVSGTHPNLFHEGVVLTSDLSSGTFGQFEALPVYEQPAAFLCKAGFDLGRIPILNRIEVDPASGDVWVGGECGRVWRLANGTWTPHKSQSDSHIVSMSMTPDGYLYLGMARQSSTNSAVVRWRP